MMQVNLSSASSSSTSEVVVKRESSGWFALVDEIDSGYRDVVRPLLQHYTDRTLGSFIEEKEINITWHYKVIVLFRGVFVLIFRMRNWNLGCGKRRNFKLI